MGFLSLTDLSSLSEASSCLSQSPVLFLDRDGVLIHSRTSSKYITDIHDIVFNDTFINSLKTFAGSLSDIVIITNQPWSSDLTDDYKRISLYVESRLKEILSFDRISTYTCPHKITHRCLCRKPKPGLVLQYLENRTHPLLKQHVLFVGDSTSDLGLSRHLMLDYMDVSDANEREFHSWSQRLMENLSL